MVRKKKDKTTINDNLLHLINDFLYFIIFFYLSNCFNFLYNDDFLYNDGLI